MQQQEAKNFGNQENTETAADRICREYRRLVDRYPGELAGERRAAFESDLKLLMTKGVYRDASGYDQVRVTEVALNPRHSRSIDAYVEYTVERGHLKDGRLPILFFLETHRFVRIDLAGF